MTTSVEAGMAGIVRMSRGLADGEGAQHQGGGVTHVGFETWVWSENLRFKSRGRYVVVRRSQKEERKGICDKGIVQLRVLSQRSDCDNSKTA
jgi:hypothetical protein